MYNTQSEVFNTWTIEMPWMTSSWRILLKGLHDFLHRLGVDQPQETHQLLSNGYPVLLSGVSTHELLSNGHPTVAYSLLWDMFTRLLTSNGCPTAGCVLVGTCLPIRFLQTGHFVTVLTVLDFKAPFLFTSTFLCTYIRSALIHNCEKLPSCFIGYCYQLSWAKEWWEYAVSIILWSIR
jgi:hypothetical protein